MGNQVADPSPSTPGGQVPIAWTADASEVLGVVGAESPSQECVELLEWGDVVCYL